MKTFSVCEQTVSDPKNGLMFRFEVDSDDTSIVRLIVTGGIKDAPEDQVRMTFRRGGSHTTTEFVDVEAEEDARVRKLAETRLALHGPTDADLEEQQERNAKQLEEDKALLEQEPKKSKYADENPLPVTEGRVLDPNDPRFSYVGAADPGSRKTGVADPDIERTLRPLDAVHAVQKEQENRDGGQQGQEYRPARRPDEQQPVRSRAEAERRQREQRTDPV